MVRIKGRGGWWAAALLGATLLGPGPAEADEIPVIPGSRVRIQAPGVVAGPVTGTVLFVDDSAVVVAAQRGGTLRIPRPAISTLELSLGRKSSAGKGARIGALIGVALGAATLSIPEDELCDPPYDTNIYCTRGGMFAYTMATAVAMGAAIGAVNRHDVWTPVGGADFRVGLASPTRGQGVGVQVALGW